MPSLYAIESDDKRLLYVNESRPDKRHNHLTVNAIVGEVSDATHVATRQSIVRQSTVRPLYDTSAVSV